MFRCILSVVTLILIATFPNEVLAQCNSTNCVEKMFVRGEVPNGSEPIIVDFVGPNPLRQCNIFVSLVASYNASPIPPEMVGVLLSQIDSSELSAGQGLNSPYCKVNYKLIDPNERPALVRPE